MSSFARLCAVVVITASTALTACGSSKPAANAPGAPTAVTAAGSVDLVGTLDGHTYAWKDVASAVVVTGSKEQFVVVVSDAAGLCNAIDSGNTSDANLLLVSITETSGTIALGTHAVNSATPSVAGEQVGMSQVVNGTTLPITNGQIALSFFATDNSVPAVLVVSGTNGVNTLSGSLEAPYCAALAKNIQKF